MEISRQEYWSGLLFPSPGDLPDPGIEPRSRALQAHALPSEPPGKSYLLIIYVYFILMCIYFSIIFLLYVVSELCHFYHSCYW